MNVANKIEPSIQFAFELHDVQGDIPFLDTINHVEFHLNGFKASCKLYSKPLHSGHILPWCSHVPLQQKIALLRTERLRTRRNCTNEVDFKEALQRHKARFINNGYPLQFVEKHYVNERQNLRQTKGKNSKTIYFRCQYIDEPTSNKIRMALKRSKLPVNLKPCFVTAAPLQVQLRPTQRDSCHKCIAKAGEKCICLRKNVVYQLRCTLCQQRYIGETNRTFLTRFKEHLSGNVTSHYFEHWKTMHNGKPTVENTSFSILQGGFSNSIQRTTAEAMFIQSSKPTINIQHPNNM